MIKCFIINLPKSIKRRESITKEMEKFRKSIDFEIIPAFDGREIVNNHVKNNKTNFDIAFDKTEVRLDLKLGFHSTVKEPLSPAEIGCALSHLKTYERILSQNIEYALVIEDDLTFNLHFSKILNPIDRLKHQWDIILFSQNIGTRSPYRKKYRLYPLPQQKTQNSEKDIFLVREGMGILDPIFNRRRIVFGTYCYFINRKACDILLKIGYPVRLPSDYLLGYPALHGLKLFTIQSDVELVHLNNSEHESLIGKRPQHSIH